MKARSEYFCQVVEQKSPLQIYCEKEFERKRQAEYEIWLVEMENLVKENLAYLSPPGEIYFEKKITVKIRRIPIWQVISIKGFAVVSLYNPLLLWIIPAIFIYWFFILVKKINSRDYGIR